MRTPPLPLALRYLWPKPQDGAAKGLLTAAIGLGLVLIVGSLVYRATESMQALDAMYFTVVTATTVGFGDCA